MSLETRYKTRTPNTAGWIGMALLGAGALAVAGAVVRSKTRRAERLHPPLGQFIEVQGVRLHYVERGSGQPLVLLHGNGSMIEDLEASGIIDLLARRYRVIAFDRPGFGHSGRPRDRLWSPVAQARLLHDALHEIGIDHAIVAGHSWGTLVALAMALEFPASVKSLVLLSGYYYPSVRLDATQGVPAIPLVGDLMRYTVSPLLGRLAWPLLVRRVFSPSPVPRRFQDFPVWMALRPSQLRAAAAETAMMAPAAMSLAGRYDELAMPVVLVAGSGDRIADPTRNTLRLHRQLAHSQLRLELGMGHMLHYLAPERILEAVDQADEAAAVLHTLPAAGLGAADQAQPGRA